MAPTFSIILATWNRGRHIVPTIKSVLQQSFTDYELLIVGDCCDDDTEAVVRPFLSERVKWHNLPQRGYSQSFPNNAGLRMAQGRYIAYLGHDDIWTPDHLAGLEKVFRTHPDARFAASGCLVYGAAGSGWYAVCGLPEDGKLVIDQFIPPSCFAHDRDVPNEIGLWRSPEEIKATVDADFLMRADQAGMRFASTGHITAHKISAAMRYLFYLNQNSVEQEIILRAMRQPAFASFTQSAAARSREIGTWQLRFPDFKNVPDGHYTRRTLVTRGIVKPQFVDLGRRVVLRQDDDRRGMDWARMMRSGKRTGRWSGRNPRPSLLLPVRTEWTVGIRVWLLDASAPDVLERLTLQVNGRRVRHRFLRRYPGRSKALLEFHARLRPDEHSALQFDLTGGAELESLLCCVEGREERIAVGDVTIRRLGWYRRLWPF